MAKRVKSVQAKRQESITTPEHVARLAAQLEKAREEALGPVDGIEDLMGVSVERLPSPSRLIKQINRATLALAHVQLSAARLLDVQSRVRRTA